MELIGSDRESQPKDMDMDMDMSKQLIAGGSLWLVRWGMEGLIDDGERCSQTSRGHLLGELLMHGNGVSSGIWQYASWFAYSRHYLLIPQRSSEEGLLIE